MTTSRTADIRPDTPFEDACLLARRHGLPSYEDWRSHQERRYERMPSWWWDKRTCEGNYVAYVDAAIKWEAEQATDHLDEHGDAG